MLQREFKGLLLDPKVVALDSQQPEFSRPIGDYVQGIASDLRVVLGRQHRAAAPWLAGIETRYGAPAEILISIWSVESSFGAGEGDFDVLRSVASLAAAGRRRDWAEGQIDAVIRIIASGEATRGQLKGSWAGAMGQTQLEPDAYLDERGGRTPAAAIPMSGVRPRTPWPLPRTCWPKAGWRRGDAMAARRAGPAGRISIMASRKAQPSAPPPPGSALGRLSRRSAGPLGRAQAPKGRAARAGRRRRPRPFLAYPNHFIIRKYNNAIPPTPLASGFWPTA